MQSLQSRLLNSTNSHALLLLLSCPMCSDGIPLKFDSAITILVADASKAVLMLGMCIAVPLCPHHTPTAVSLTLPPRVGNTIAGGGATFNLNRFHDTIIQKAQLSLVRRHIHLPSRCTSNCVCRPSPSSPSIATVHCYWQQPLPPWLPSLDHDHRGPCPGWRARQGWRWCRRWSRRRH